MSARAAIAAAVGAAALIAFPYWSASWESSRYATTILTDVLVFAVFAASLELLVGRAGLPSLGHAAFFGAGAYAAAIVGQRLQTTEPLVTVGAAALVGLVLALVIGAFAVRAAGIVFLMLTLAFAQMVFAFAFQATDLTGGSNGFSGVGRPAILGLSLASSDALFSFTAVVFVLVSLLLARVVRSPYGHALVGIRENERRMRALGYDTYALKLSAFALAGSLAGIAGALSAFAHRFVSPNDAALSTSINGFVMVLIGGAGTLAGPLVGSAAVIGIERVLSSSIPFSQTVLGVVFIVFVLAARQGIVGVTLGALRSRGRGNAVMSK